MKKFLIGILAVIVIGFAGVQIAEHVVMGGDDYYVQITTDGQKEVVKEDNGQEYINYKYIVTGYDEDGKEKQLEFTGQQDRPLRKSAYLKVTWNKKKGVTSYEEVKQSDIPKTAEKKLNKG
ncbi:YxeA family protein [Enterococcus sp. ZJ1668]|uniref:YxeA family protein n=1 Tax=Enterococcus sp. ZJ1668 TaxID=2709402 RepID=UPI0013EB5CE3|nr:YxeA family protein [Enterococcus sp. ZJ1668]